MLYKAVVLVVFVVVVFGLAVVEVIRTKQDKFSNIHAFPYKYKYNPNSHNNKRLDVEADKITNFKKRQVIPPLYIGQITNPSEKKDDTIFLQI